MEILKRLEKTWEIETKAGFSFKSLKTLEDFFDFVTDPSNASLVLSSGLYRLNELKQLPKDSESLKKEGAILHCQGKIILLGGLILPAEARFQVTEFEKYKKVGLECQKVELGSREIPARMSAIWNFTTEEEYTADLSISLGLRLPAPLLSITPFLPGQNFVDHEMAVAAQRIARGFKERERSV